VVSVVGVSNAFQVADAFVDEMVAANPVVATYLGIPGSDHLWGDVFGMSGIERANELRLHYRTRIGPHLVSDVFKESLTARVMLDSFEESHTAYEAGDHWRTLRHLGSPYHRITDVFSVMPTATPANRDDVVARLETLALPLRDYRALLQSGIDHGVTVAERQVSSVIDQARRTAADSNAFGMVVDRLERAGLGSSYLDAAVDEARLAIGEFAQWLESSYLPFARAGDAVGPEIYGRAVDTLVGLSLDPGEVYEWGWDEFGRLREEMRRVAHEIDPDASVEGVKEYLETDPSVTVRGTDALLVFVAEKLAEAVDDLAGKHFDVPDRIRPLTVHLDPPPRPLGVHYVRPSEDFTRPGGVWYSVGDQEVFPLYQHVSTAYHEGFPGHHLQIATAMSRPEEISRFQRAVTFYPGYGEGWAMYAEVLMGELGYLDNPQHHFGMLAKQMYRAARVVVDIGLHLGKRVHPLSPIAPGEPWAFDIAVDFMKAYGFRTPDQALAEVLRYLGWPGQAIAYKVGEREILSIREDARHRLGDSFDLRQFHSTLLGHGPMRLDLLGRVVAERLGT
jgi:YD repeat-containing protein